MKTIIAGSRDIGYLDLRDAMDNCPFSKDITTVISGTARGADTFGEDWAAKNSINIIRFPANWSRFGRGAGHIRNKEMAEYAHALVAVWDGKSPGTKNMIATGRNSDLLVYVWDISKNEGYLV